MITTQPMENECVKLEEHTPAPWTWKQYRSNWMLWGPNSTPIIFIPGGDSMAHPDAKLIQAAPDLLGACKALREALNKWASEHDPDLEEITEIRAQLNMAINKAEGITAQ